MSGPVSGPVAVQVLAGRAVPLGGIRAITVRRTLPHRERSFIGAWCFADHYGPQQVAADGSGGMDVPPHPHTGLQTASWLFSGEIEHRDSGGVVATVRPGELNLMTAGHGIAHSEVSTRATTVLHGVQLWIVLPEANRDVARDFAHYAPDPVALPERDAGVARVFLGKIAGLGSSPVATHTPLLGAEITVAPGATTVLPVDAEFEHGVLLDTGQVSVAGTAIQPGDLAYVAAGQRRLEVSAGPDGARLLLLGGTPYDEEVVMWWNFVGRNHQEVAEYRQLWEAGALRFGAVPGYAGPTDRVPAPPMPQVRLKPRSRFGKR